MAILVNALRESLLTIVLSDGNRPGFQQYKSFKFDWNEIGCEKQKVGIKINSNENLDEFLKVIFPIETKINHHLQNNIEQWH